MPVTGIFAVNGRPIRVLNAARDRPGLLDQVAALCRQGHAVSNIVNTA
jgi:hypothetical protein